MPTKLMDKEIDALKDSLEQQLGWGKVDEWHSSMFSELSEKIFEQTGSLLSATTLKRFFGVVYFEGLPSTTTLDTISQYIGYSNWRSFKHRQKKRKYSFLKNIPGRTFYVSLGFFIGILTIALVATNSFERPIVLEDIQFSSEVLTNTYPNSVVFSLGVSSLEPEGLKIQQYWDESKTISILPEQEKATGIYYFPGYFRAKLLSKGQILKEHDLFLKSNGWIGTIDYEQVPKYFKPNQTKENYLGFSDEIFREIRDSETPLTSTYHYVNDLGDVSADNLKFTSRVQINYHDKWAVCKAARLYILGTNGALIIPFSELGCSSDNSIMLNEKFIDGKQEDLSMFASDLSMPTDLSIQVRDKVVSVFINDHKVYTATYEKSVGNFVGARFKFLGIGKVESLEVLESGESVILQ